MTCLTCTVDNGRDVCLIWRFMSVQHHHTITTANQYTTTASHAPCIRQLGLHEKLLGLLGRVVRRLPGDALHLLELLRLCCSLDVLVVHLRVLAKRDVRSEVKVQAMIRLEGLEKLDDLLSRQLVSVLLCHLHHDLQVLLHVGGEELPQALECPVG